MLAVFEVRDHYVNACLEQRVVIRALTLKGIERKLESVINKHVQFPEGFYFEYLLIRGRHATVKTIRIEDPFNEEGVYTSYYRR
jgi:hypothetical protein